MSKSVILEILKPIGRFLKAYWPALFAFSTSAVISIAIIIHSIQFSIHRNPEEWFLLASLFIANEVAFLALPYIATMDKKSWIDWLAGAMLYLISISPSTLEVADIIVPKIKEIQTSTYISKDPERSSIYDDIKLNIKELRQEITEAKAELKSLNPQTEDELHYYNRLKNQIRGKEGDRDQQIADAKKMEEKYQSKLDTHEVASETSEKTKSNWVSNTLIWWEVVLRIFMIPILQGISILFLIHGPSLMLKGSVQIKKWEDEDKINSSLFTKPTVTQNIFDKKENTPVAEITTPLPLQPNPVDEVHEESDIKKQVIGTTYHQDPSKRLPSTEDIIKNRMQRQQEQKGRIVKGEVGRW